MRSSIYVALKNFFRNTKYMLIYAILVLLSNCYLARLSDNAVSLAEFQLASLKLGIVGYLFFCLLGYEYISLSRLCGIKETFQTIEGVEEKLFFSQFMLLFSLVLFWCMNIFCWVTWMYFRLQTNYLPFFINAILSAFLDLVFPGSIAILLGSVLALNANREVAYSVVFISALFCSPVPSMIFSSEEIFGCTILRIFDWFAILAPNTDWVADTLYGVSVEPYRWFLAAFYFFILFSIIAFILAKGNKRKNACALLLFVLSLLSCMRFICRDNDCIIRKDFRPDGTLQAEFNYRKNNSEQTAKAANFSVENYIIDLTIRSNTKADVYLTLAENDLNEYIFTLYHGYSVERVDDANGSELEFERNGDFITVYTNEGARELHFTYSGNAGKYFANYQGIALPGYLPFYPVPGHIKLWESSKSENVVNTDREPAYFDVYVDSNLMVSSNLERIANNTFSGYGEAVSLYAGMQIPEKAAGATVWCSPISHQSLNLDGYEEVWKNLADRVGEPSDFNLNGKSIFLQPMTILSTNASQEAYAEFDDHIIVGNWSPSAEDICKSHLLSLIPKDDTTNMLYDAFADYLAFGGNTDSSKVDWSEIEILTKYTSANEVANEDEWFCYIDAKRRFDTLFQYKVNSLGESYVLKSVYQYLLDPDGNQIEYLYNLGG